MVTKGCERGLEPAAAGDPAQMLERAHRHRGQLVEVARRRLPPQSSADDVVSEAILRAAKLDALSDEHLVRWLTRVTVDLCYDEGRESRRRVALTDGADVTPDIAETFADREHDHWCAGLVGDLPRSQRNALLLRADGRSVPDIARERTCCRGLDPSRQSRGRAPDSRRVGRGLPARRRSRRDVR